MNKRQLFDHVSHMETQIGQLYEQLGDLKSNLSDIIEENHRLVMENQHLRTFLEGNNIHDKENSNQDTPTVDVPGEGFDNLARIYKEGFHICHMQFGSPRTDEDCMFCLDLFD